MSDSTDIPVSSLSDFENAKREPRLAHLERLARAHGLPLAWFFTAGADEPAVVLWRMRPESPATAAAIEGQFLKLCGWYQNLEKWCGEVQPCDLPQAAGDRSRFNWAAAESLASVVRNQLNLGQRPACSLLNVLENTCGVRIFHLEFDPSGTAACTRSDESGMAILLNSRNKRWRRNFDLAHELFHLLTWRIFRVGEKLGQADEQEEKLADKFASCLLMPEEPLRVAIAAATRSGGGLKHAELFDLARQFDVSIDALLWRIHGVFNRKREETERDLVVCKSMREVFDVRDDVPPPALPERYRALTLRALREGELSIGRAAEYLGISRQEAMRLDDIEDVRDDAITLDPA